MKRVFNSQALTAMKLLISKSSLRERLGHAEVVNRWTYWREQANRETVGKRERG